MPAGYLCRGCLLFQRLQRDIGLEFRAVLPLGILYGLLLPKWLM